MSPRSAVPHLAVLVLTLALAQTVSTSALADVVYLNQFAVTRGSNIIFNDSFDRDTTLAGLPPAVVYSGVNFSNDSPANYFVSGTITESTANGGQAQLDTANGVVITQPDPFLPVVQFIGARLLTGVNVLTPSVDFSAAAVFDLTIPSTPLGTYDLFLTNRQTGIDLEGNTLVIRVRDCTPAQGGCRTLSGPVLQFVWLDFINNDASLLNQVALTLDQLANEQIGLLLSHSANNPERITAAYAFGNSGVFGGLTQLGTTGTRTNVFTPSLQFVRAGFEAFAPVPEPSVLVLVAIGLVALGSMNSQRGRLR